MGALQITIVGPGTQHDRTGNATTARRWRAILRQLGHRVSFAEPTAEARPCDLLIALHSIKCAAFVRRFHAAAPRAAVFVTLTGTDVYGTSPPDDILRLATRIIVLQKTALQRLTSSQRRKAVVVLQSVPTPATRVRKRTRTFDVTVVAQLRRVKDPFRAAMATRDLPATSRILVRHAGPTTTAAYAARARQHMRRNARYVWLGALTPARTLRLMQQSRALVLSSRTEGGANVVSEAVVLGVPILATRIDGTTGLLGEAYGGYFEVGDTPGLRDLLLRFESEPAFRQRLERHIARLAPHFAPAREREVWMRLLRELR